MNYCAQCGREWDSTHVCPPMVQGLFDSLPRSGFTYTLGSTSTPALTEEDVRRIVREEIRRALDYQGASARTDA